MTDLLCASLLALATLACSQYDPSPELRSPNCSEQSTGWTTEKLADAALLAATGEINRRGAVVTISQDGCRFYVAVRREGIRYAGAHFMVTISAVDGTIIEVTGGE
jgi:hypothetical protein